MSVTVVTATDRAVVYVREVEAAEMVMLQPGEVLVTPQPVHHAEAENDLLALLGVASDAFPPLPDAGWLTVGAVYQYGDGAVIVRQSHERSIYAPEDTPALFMVWREDAAVLEWIAGEQVQVGTRRMYEGVEYECLQGHVTESTWTPPATPALWAVVVAEPEPSAEWAVGVSYKVGDVVTYGGAEYECRQAHTSISTWTPSAVLALWLPL